MSQGNVTFFVYKDLVDRVIATLPSSLHARIQPFVGSLDSLFTTGGVPTGASHYSIVIATAELLADGFSPADDLVGRVQGGQIRLVVCGDTSGIYLPVPYTSISDAFSRELGACLWAHVTRAPGWGLTTLLPSGARLWTERLQTEQQLATKIEQAVAFVAQHQPALKNRLIRFRLAMMAAAQLAMAQQPTKAIKPPVFQIGLSDHLVFFGLRWMAEIDADFWQNPPVTAQAMLSYANASVVQISFSTKEQEVALVFDPSATPEAATSPTALDFISNERLAAAAGFDRAAALVSFETFEMIPEDKTPSFMIIRDGAGVNTSGEQQGSNLELRGVRVENEKLTKQLADLQTQLTEANRKIGQLVEAAKAPAAGAVDKRLDQLRLALTTTHKKETDVLKDRIEKAKAKELELTKRLSQTIEALNQAKSATKKESA